MYIIYIYIWWLRLVFHFVYGVFGFGKVWVDNVLEGKIKLLFWLKQT